MDSLCAGKIKWSMTGTVLMISVAYAAYPAWQEGTTYKAGTIVSYQRHDYQALQSHTALLGAGWYPSTSPTLWKDLGASSGGTLAPTPSPSLSPSSAGCATRRGTLRRSMRTLAHAITAGRNYVNKWWTQGDDPTQSGAYGPCQDLDVCSTPTPSGNVTYHRHNQFPPSSGRRHRTRQHEARRRQLHRPRHVEHHRGRDVQPSRRDVLSEPAVQ